MLIVCFCKFSSSLNLFRDIEAFVIEMFEKTLKNKNVSINNLPKKILDLFPIWSYQCPTCGKQYDDAVQACTQCGTIYEQAKWRIPPRFLKNKKAMSEYAHKILAPKLTPKQRELLFQYFTEFFNDGFESSGISNWTDVIQQNGGVGTVTSANNPYSGVYHYKASIDGTAPEQIVYVYKNLSSISTAYGRAYVKFDALPVDWAFFLFLSFSNGDNNISYLGLQNRGGTNYVWVIYVYDGDWREFTSPSFTPSLNTYYLLELKTVIHSASGEVKAYVNETEVISQSGLSTDKVGNINRIAAGVEVYPQGAGNIYIDSVVAADTYIGPEKPAGAEANFETGDTSEFDGTPESNGTVTVTSDVVHRGIYSCKCDVNANGGAYAEGFFDIDEQHPVYCRGYFRFNQLPETNRDYTIISFENTNESTTVGYIQLIDDNGTRKWKMRRDTGSAEYSTSTSNIPDVDIWVYVEFAHGASLAKLWVDGDELLSHTDASDQKIDRVHVGACDSDIDADDTLEIYVDDVIVNSEFIGPDLIVNELNVNNKLNLTSDAEKSTKDEIYNIVWGFDERGVWQPQFRIIPHGKSYLRMQDTETGNYADLSLVLMEGHPDPEEYDTLHAFSHGVVVKKDLAAGGVLSSYQGTLYLGSGLLNMVDVPRISLINANRQRLIDAVYQSTPPDGASIDDYYVNTNDSHLYQYKGNEWIDKGEASNFNVVHRLASAPDNPQLGQLYVKTGDNNLYIWTVIDGIPQWTELGNKSQFQDNFDTLYIQKMSDNQEPAHLDVGNISIHSHLSVGDTVTSNLNPSPGLDLGNLSNYWTSVVTSGLSIKSTNNAFVVTAGDNGENQDTYLVPQNPSEGGLGLGTAEYPFKWIDVTSVFTQSINTLSGDLTIYPPTIFNSGIKSHINPSVNNAYGLGSGTHAWQGVVAYTVYADDYYPKTGGNATFHGNVTGNANYASTAGYATSAGSAPPTSHSDHTALAIGGVTVFNSSRQLASLNGVATHFNPAQDDVYGLGSGTLKWAGIVVMDVYYGDLHDDYDEFDDFEILKTFEPVTVIDRKGKLRNVIDPQALTIFKPDEDNTDGMVDLQKISGFQLSAMKRFVYRFEEIEERLARLEVNQ